MEQNIISQLSKDCSSQSDLLHRLLAIESFLEFYFYQNQTLDFSRALEAYFFKKNLSDWDKALLLSYPSSFYESFKLDNFYQLLEQIRKEIGEREKLTICLPFKLEPSQEKKIGEKAVSILKNKVFLEFRLEPDLAAGCALIFRGVYKDYSLAFLLQKKEKIIADIISSYA